MNVGKEFFVSASCMVLILAARRLWFCGGRIKRLLSSNSATS